MYMYKVHREKYKFHRENTGNLNWKSLWEPLAAGSSNFAGMFLRGSSCATSWPDLCVISDLDPLTFDLDIHFGLGTVKIFSDAEGYSAILYFL